MAATKRALRDSVQWLLDEAKEAAAALARARALYDEEDRIERDAERAVIAARRQGEAEKEAAWRYQEDLTAHSCVQS